MKGMKNEKVNEKVRIVNYIKGFKLSMEIQFKKLISYIYKKNFSKVALVNQAETHLLTQGRKWMRFRTKSTALVA